MNLIKDVQKIIANKVDQALKQKGMSVRSCTDAFNSCFQKEIKNQLIQPMNKDTIQRIRSGKFSLPNRRVSDLCDFLEVSLEVSATPSHEAQLIEKIIRQQPDLKRTLNHLLNHIYKQEVKNEIY